MEHKNKHHQGQKYNRSIINEDIINQDIMNNESIHGGVKCIINEDITSPHLTIIIATKPETTHYRGQGENKSEIKNTDTKKETRRGNIHETACIGENQI